jgi:hypothetical protein
MMMMMMMMIVIIIIIIIVMPDISPRDLRRFLVPSFFVLFLNFCSTRLTHCNLFRRPVVSPLYLHVISS